MKAAIFFEHGGPEKIQIQDVEEPEFKDNEVLISVHYCGLNRLDLYTRNGSSNLKIDLPHIGGADTTGIIHRIGKDVSNVKIGDHVVVNAAYFCNICENCLRGEQSLCHKFKMFGEHLKGGMAEFVSIPARNLYKIPDGISCRDLAAMGLVTLTAWRMLSKKAKLKPGQTVLIPGAGGGLSSAGIQIAKLLGAKVIAVTSTEDKEMHVKELGADFVLNYRTNTNWAKDVWNYTNKRGVDVVFESVGEITWQNSLRSLKKGGKLITAGATTGFEGNSNIGLIFYKQLEILGSTMANRAEFEEAMELLIQGKVKPNIDKEFALDKLGEAHKYLEEGMHIGKIVIKIRSCQE